MRICTCAASAAARGGDVVMSLVATAAQCYFTNRKRLECKRGKVSDSRTAQRYYDTLQLLEMVAVSTCSSDRVSTDISAYCTKPNLLMLRNVHGHRAMQNALMHKVLHS
jgi:hypothetical protein